MSANVETMFYVRETPWHGLGTKVMKHPILKQLSLQPGWTGKSCRNRFIQEKGNLLQGIKPISGILTAGY